MGMVIRREAYLCTRGLQHHPQTPWFVAHTPPMRFSCALQPCCREAVLLWPQAKGGAAELASSCGDGTARAAALQPLDAATTRVLYFSSKERAGDEDVEGEAGDMGPVNWSALFMQLSRWVWRRGGPPVSSE